MKHSVHFHYACITFNNLRTIKIMNEEIHYRHVLAINTMSERSYFRATSRSYGL